MQRRGRSGPAGIVILIAIATLLALVLTLGFSVLFGRAAIAWPTRPRATQCRWRLWLVKAQSRQHPRRLPAWPSKLRPKRFTERLPRQRPLVCFPIGLQRAS